MWFFERNFVRLVMYFVLMRWFVNDWWYLKGIWLTIRIISSSLFFLSSSSLTSSNFWIRGSFLDWVKFFISWRTLQWFSLILRILESTWVWSFSKFSFSFFIWESSLSRDLNLIFRLDKLILSFSYCFKVSLSFFCLDSAFSFSFYTLLLVWLVVSNN